MTSSDDMLQVSWRGHSFRSLSCLAALILIVSAPPLIPKASALEERWHHDTVSGSHSLPVVVDYDGDGVQEILFTTRSDGTLWALTARGVLKRRFARDQWLESIPALLPAPGEGTPSFAFQDSTGSLNLSDFTTNTNLRLPMAGAPASGVAPCVCDLDGDGVFEIVCAHSDGLVAAFSSKLKPLWRFDAGDPIRVSPAGGAIFTDRAAIYLQTARGTVHCVSGHGIPLWRFQMAYPPSPSSQGATIAQFAGESPFVTTTDVAGWIYALDAATGQEVWRVQPASAIPGNAAVIDAHPHPGREICVLYESGEFAILSAQGSLLSITHLPERHYVPNPLIADLDGDGALEIAAPTTPCRSTASTASTTSTTSTHAWSLIIASLDGTTREEVALRGNALHGMVLADLDGDGALELLAATDAARLHCFATSARAGWTHPRANQMLNGCVLPLEASQPKSQSYHASRGIRLGPCAVSDFSGESIFGNAVISFKGRMAATTARVVLREGSTVVGSADKAFSKDAVTIPCVRHASQPLTLDIALFDEHGEVIAADSGIPLRGPSSRPVQLTPPETFSEVVKQLAAAYQVPADWALPSVSGRTSWHIAPFAPAQWAKYGLDGTPLIQEAIPVVRAPAALPFGPTHPAWNAIKTNLKPFLIENGPLDAQRPYSKGAHEAVVDMAGDRFLGYLAHKWPEEVWDERIEPFTPPSASQNDVKTILKTAFGKILTNCHDRVYQGQGHWLAHHQAFAQGAPMGYAVVGEDIPCASVRFAFLRGAARQHGVRPWGACVSNRFCEAYADTARHSQQSPLKWNPNGSVSGPDCGHSSSLEVRLEMAAHLAGATFVHHDPEASTDSILVTQADSGEYTLSPFGAAIKQWHDYSLRFPGRGIPYTPIAFLTGDGPASGLPPHSRPRQSTEQVLHHAFSWDGSLDFEQGFLTNGVYGDVFDVISANASSQVMQSYGVIWPLGLPEFSSKQKENLRGFVERGGILVLNSPQAQGFSREFLGVRFRGRFDFDTQIQTALQAIPPCPTPYRYTHMSVPRKTGVLAWTGSGDPLVAWRPYGKGLVIVSATRYWLDERGRLLPIVPALMQSLTQPFLPFQLSTPVQMLLNRTDQGWIIGLINNRGVRKVPTQPAAISTKESRQCVMRFRGRVPLRFTAHMGQFEWSRRANGLSAELPPGGIAIVEVRLSSRLGRHAEKDTP